MLYNNKEHCCPINLKDVDWVLIRETITRMDAGVEPTGRHSRRASRISAQFMPHTLVKQLNPSSYPCFNAIFEKLMRQQ